MTVQWTKEQQAEHRRVWVKALRSGKYKQGLTVLRNNDGGFCCLGVGCDISGLGKWEGSTYRTPVDQMSSVATDDVRDWLGLRRNNGSYFALGRSEALSAMNDDGASFSEIADIIESEPEGLIAK